MGKGLGRSGGGDERTGWGGCREGVWGWKEREEGKERAGHWLPASSSLLVSG